MESKVDEIRRLVRPFIAFCFVGTAVFLAVTGKIKPAEFLLPTSMIIAFYFGERAGKKTV